MVCYTIPMRLTYLKPMEKSLNQTRSSTTGWLQHYSWLTLATIPLYTLGTYVSFKSQGYNYIELFVLNTFKASQRLLLHIVTFPVLLHFNATPTIKTVMLWLYVLDIVLIYWIEFSIFQ
jgi:hypothetical protein